MTEIDRKPMRISNSPDDIIDSLSPEYLKVLLEKLEKKH